MDNIKMVSNLSPEELAQAKAAADRIGGDIEQLANAISNLIMLARMSMKAKGFEARDANATAIAAVADAYARTMVESLETGKAVETFDSTIPAFRKVLAQYTDEYAKQLAFTGEANVSEQGHA